MKQSRVTMFLFLLNLVGTLTTQGWAVPLVLSLGEEQPTRQPPTAPSGPTQWKTERVLFIPWGDGPQQVGIENKTYPDGSTGSSKGLPASFCVAPDGAIYIADYTCGRVKVYNSKGNWLKNLSSEIDLGFNKSSVKDLAANERNLWVLGGNRSVRHFVLPDFKFLKEFPMPDEIPLRPHRLILQGEEIRVGGRMADAVVRENGTLGGYRGDNGGYHQVVVGTTKDEVFNKVRQKGTVHVGVVPRSLKITLKKTDPSQGIAASTLLVTITGESVQMPKRGGDWLGMDAQGWMYFQEGSFFDFRFMKGEETVFGIYRAHVLTGQEETLPILKQYGSQLPDLDSYAWQKKIFFLLPSGTLYQMLGDDDQGVTIMRYVPNR